ncbi:MAG: T9SS type A sorting domain-containing protein, partial [Hyphomicrobiales bacterium]
PGTVVKNDMSKIRAVPNPYYAHSQYELTQFDRVMKFTNIPSSKKVTIRIFNLAGDLVRTISRSAAAGDDMSSSEITWDLNTANNLPVASGIYIVRIDVDGVGSRTDRIAVFTEQERLDNF